jgi:glycosyltransferase involved in cell wall biosynthesis
VESLRRSQSIIAISQYVRDDVVTRLGLDPSRVVAVPLAAASSFRVAASSVDDTARDEVIWVLGGLNPNKNLDTMLRAWALGDLPRLVVVGALPSRVQWRVRALAAIARAPAPTFAGRIADGELAARMRSACCVIVPSLAEGFGLPVAEARAAGARVIASDIPVLRELADEGVDYASPRDAGAWRDAIVRARSTTSRPAPSTRRDWDDVARDIARVLAR